MHCSPAHSLESMELVRTSNNAARFIELLAWSECPALQRQYYFITEPKKKDGPASLLPRWVD